MGHRSSLPPTNIRSSSLDVRFPTTQVDREGSPGPGALAKSVDQAFLGPGSTNPQDLIAVPERPQVLAGNRSTNATCTTQNASALLSPVLVGRQGIRRRQTPRYNHVSPVQLELLLDNAVSFTEILKYSPCRARSAGIWRHNFLNNSEILHQRTGTLDSAFDMVSRDDDIAPTA
jgi:hypothetical protein